jgi:hypothetical protein
MKPFRPRSVFLLLAGVAAALIQPQSMPSAQVPVVGASASDPLCPTRVERLTRANNPEDPSPAEQLKALLYDRTFAGTIVIPRGLTVEMGESRGVPINTCVTIQGTRNGLDRGALITATHRDTEGPVFVVFGQRVRIEGLRFRGPVTPDDRDPSDTAGSIKAILVADYATATIDNNLFEFWGAAVAVNRPVPPPLSCRGTPAPVTVTRNYFNRNAIEGKGYGVVVGDGCARIEGNLFNKNRHAVAASGNVDNGKGYIARYNYVLEGGFRVCEWWGCYWNQHFDVHGTGSGGYGGTAGEYFDISSNTIRGEQRYGLGETRPAFMLRGKPTLGAFFDRNVLVHNDADAAISLKGADCYKYILGFPDPPFEGCGLYVGADNHFNADMIYETAVGDFDGDGRDDVFLATGTAWWYSSAGLTEWRFLRASTARVADMRFGKFDHDQRTDVLLSAGGNWYVSSGGTGSPLWIRGDGTSLLDCVFGDFNHDGVTDALRADGSTWSIAYNATGPWMWRRDSWVRAENLRVADFTNDQFDDVFWIESNTWNLWNPATNVWTRDTRKPVLNSDMPLLIVADFDGDGRADLAKTQDYDWIWLRAGSLEWALLRGSAGQGQYRDIRSARIGRFTAGDRRADAIRFPAPPYTTGSLDAFIIWNGSQDAFVQWSPGGQEMR